MTCTARQSERPFGTSANRWNEQTKKEGSRCGRSSQARGSCDRYELVRVVRAQIAAGECYQNLDTLEGDLSLQLTVDGLLKHLKENEA